MTVRAYLLTRPVFDLNSFLTFLAEEKLEWIRSSEARDPETIVEAAGRVCYLSFGKGRQSRANTEYIKHLIKSGHESVLEHVCWGFVLTGISRAFSHQLVRHRVGFAFSQLSQQYHDERDADFLEPTQLPDFSTARDAWQSATRAARKAYRDIIGTLQALEADAPVEEKKEIRRAIRSAARSVLPNATETKIFVTANARALRHFFSVRGSILGDEEMRRVSAALLSIVKSEAPALFYDFRLEMLPDKSPIVRRKLTRRT